MKWRDGFDSEMLFASRPAVGLSIHADPCLRSRPVMLPPSTVMLPLTSYRRRFCSARWESITSHIILVPFRTDLERLLWGFYQVL